VNDSIARKSFKIIRLVGAFISLCLAVTGCSQPVAQVDTAGVQPHVDYSELAVFLLSAVDDDTGFIRQRTARRLTDNLTAQLRLFAVTGPESTPDLLVTAEDRLAYWYNARAAWAIRLAELADCPETLPSTSQPLESRPFRLDGREMTLSDIDAAIYTEGGWLAVAAAPGILMDRAELPETPFSAADIRQRIGERFSRFIDDDERFIIDALSRQIRLPPVIWQYRGELLSAYREKYGTDATLREALMEYVEGSPWRRLRDAVGYTCVKAQPTQRLGCIPMID